MLSSTGNLRNILVSKNRSQFSLKGMINPTFQNDGDATVYIDGRKLLTGETYAVNVPTVVLQNSISITFERDANKSKILYIGFVEANN